MPRDAAAYLREIAEACDSIESILAGVSLEGYIASREKRSATEREFILIGEATVQLRRVAPELFDRLSHGHLAIGMRNVLTHDYISVDHESVYETAIEDAPRFKEECTDLLMEMKGG
jgi:uncharacterized protein with HEPN domain